jgi:3-oxoacyl-[acyl-carrier-protein] synthase II
MFAADCDDPIVVTGLGVVSPLGADRESSWQQLLAGHSAARRLTPSDLGVTDADSFPQWIGCPALLPREDGIDRITQLARQAAKEAVADANLPAEAVDPNRLGCVFGTSKGSLFAATSVYCGLSGEESFPALWPSTAASSLSQQFDCRGPCLAPVAACATGVVAVIRAAALIREGACDVVLAGSADDSLHPLVLASFQRLGVLARHPDPQQASRPFDQQRTGFVIGAGAGGLVLERRSHAIARGARWYAALGPGRITADPTGMTTLDASGETLTQMLRDCRPGDCRADYVHLHGTGTRLNDPAECRAVRQACETHAGVGHAGSFKGAMGHLLGAAGSVELALCCLAIRDRCLPPNVNLVDRDSDCDLPWVGAAAESADIRSVLKVALGFGGHQAAIWLQRCLGSGDRTA